MTPGYPFAMIVTQTTVRFGRWVRAHGAAHDGHRSRPHPDGSGGRGAGGQPPDRPLLRHHRHVPGRLRRPSPRHRVRGPRGSPPVIASLTGEVAEVLPAAAVVDVAGVGYLVHAPASVLAGLGRGQHVRLLTHLVVREDSMTLYGFRTADQREVFQTLMGVSGVGPKLALAVLSVFEPLALRQAVAAGDIDALTSVPGVGRRGAQRMLLELRDRLDVVIDESAVPGSALGEVREALAGLPYTPPLVRGGSERLAPPTAPGAGTALGPPHPHPRPAPAKGGP